MEVLLEHADGVYHRVRTQDQVTQIVEEGSGPAGSGEIALEWVPEGWLLGRPSVPGAEEGESASAEPAPAPAHEDFEERLHAGVPVAPGAGAPGWARGRVESRQDLRPWLLDRLSELASTHPAHEAWDCTITGRGTRLDTVIRHRETGEVVWRCHRTSAEHTAAEFETWILETPPA